MYFKSKELSVLMILILGALGISGQAPPVLSVDTPIPIAFLGSYHMSNPGADRFNLEADDVYSPRRQAEIKELVQLLKAFQPTKIAVEALSSDSSIQSRYIMYLGGEISLSRKEREQIGFRLAKAQGHSTIYPIDVRLNLDSKAVEKLVQADPMRFGVYLGQLEDKGNKAMEMMARWLKNGTVREMMLKMNEPEMLKMAHEIYFASFVPIVKAEDYAGPDMVTLWYQRNLSIFSNLHQMDLQPDDRILVIYGQGHIPLLRQFAEDSPYFDPIDILPFLKPEKRNSPPALEPRFSALIVKDLDQSIEWYQEKLGLELLNRTAKEQIGLRQANLKRGNIYVELIELASAMQLEDLIPDDPGKTKMQGIFKIGFGVQAFDQWLTHLNNVHASFHGQVVKDPISERRMLIILDPDGNRIQLFEK